MGSNKHGNGSKSQAMAFPWTIWGIMYMCLSIGVMIGLYHSSINPGHFVRVALWILWSITLLLGCLVSMAAYAVLQGGQETPTTAEMIKKSAGIMFKILRYLIPGVFFIDDPYSKGARVDRSLSRRETYILVAIWSAWGLLNAVLGGFYAHQAIYMALFGAIFLVPGLVGWARFQGILD